MAKRKPCDTAILRAANAKCVRCGSKSDLEINHIIPLSQGGTNEASNLEIRCKKCHDKYHGHISKKLLR
jgi:5-methylcytosine-specific restriction endonuclease McrA